MSSNSPKLETWDYITGSVLIAMASGAAVYRMATAKRQGNMKDFLVSSNDIGIVTLMLSSAATHMSAIGTLGMATETYQNGISFLMFSISPLLAIPFVIFFHLPVFHVLEISSIFEYLERRFNKGVRLCASILMSLQLVLYSSVAMYAPALALNQVTGLHIWGSLASIGILCVLYTSLGGIKAVIWADATQCMVMIVVTLAVLVKGTADLGGISEVWRIGEEGKRTQFFVFGDSPDAHYSFWSNAIGGGFYNLSMFGASQLHMQRYLSNRTLRGARISAIGSVFTTFILLLLPSIGGFIMYARYHDCDPLISGQVTTRDQISALFAIETLGYYEGLPGIFVAAIMCATLSTLSSTLNSLSAISIEDYINPLYPHLSEEYKIGLSKVLAIVYGALCMGLVAVVANLEGVVQVTLAIQGGIGGPVLALFTVGMALPWVNAWGAISGFFSGILLVGWAVIGNLIVKPPVRHAPFGTKGCNISLAISHFNQSDVIEAYDAFASTVETQTHIQELDSFALALYTSPTVWYASWSVGIGLVTALLISMLTGYQKPDELDPRLLFPSTRKLCSVLPKKYQKLLCCELGKNFYLHRPIRESNYYTKGQRNTRSIENENSPKMFGVQQKIDEEQVPMSEFQTENSNTTPQTELNNDDLTGILVNRFQL